MTLAMTYIYNREGSMSPTPSTAGNVDPTPCLYLEVPQCSHPGCQHLCLVLLYRWLPFLHPLPQHLYLQRQSYPP